MKKSFLTILFLTGFLLFGQRAFADQTTNANDCLNADQNSLPNFYCWLGDQVFDTSPNPTPNTLITSGSINTIQLLVHHHGAVDGMGGSGQVSGGAVFYGKPGHPYCYLPASNETIPYDGEWHIATFNLASSTDSNTGVYSSNCSIDYDSGEKLGFIHLNAYAWDFAWADSNIYTDGVSTQDYTSFGISSNYSLWFKINYTPISTVGFTAPPPNSLLTTATSTTLTGICPTNGTSELELTYEPFLARLDPSGNYNIDCTLNTWTANITPRPGSNEIWIVDKSAIGENPPNIFNLDRYGSLVYDGDITASDWAINLITPQLGNDHWLYLSPANPYVFKFTVQKPASVANSDITMGFEEFQDFDRTTPSSTDEFIGLDSITVNGQIEHHYDINTSTTPTYYRVYLKYGSSTPVYLDFNVLATTDTADFSVQQTVPPNGSEQDLGFWGDTFRTLFVPDPSQLEPLVQAEQSNMAQSIPFSYFYQAKAILEAQTIATATPATINLVIPSGDFGSSTTTAPVALFGTVVTDPVRSFSDQLRTYVTAGIWLAFLGYVIKRFAELLST